MGFLEAVIRRRVMTTVLVLTAVILGAQAYLQMPVRRFPDVDFPVATVTTIFPGAGPEEVEAEITRRIEDAVSSVAGLDMVKSFSQQGVSLVLIQFNLEEDIDLKAMDIRDRIDAIRAQLPEDAEDPVTAKFDFAAMPIVTIALSGPQDVNELYRLADEVLADRLARIGGVAEIQITGGRQREIHVFLDGAKLRRHAVSVDEVAAAIRGANIEVPAGNITEPGTEYTLKTTGKFSSIEEILSVPVRSTADGVLELRHLGTVEDGLEKERDRSRADGSNGVIISVMKQSDANAVEVSNGVRKTLKKLQELIPPGATLFIAADTSNFVRGALANVRSNMIAGIILTSLALYLFLGSWRGTVITALVMPSALLVTFLFMMFSDITINILTLTALALSMGIIVNNAILILENSQRFVEKGMEPVEAAIAGTKDIALAIVSSTLTNLVVFLPIAFMGEIIGMFFKEFGLTIVYVTTVSLGISFSLTPMMCGLLLRADEATGSGGGQLAKFLVDVPRVWNEWFGGIQARYLKLLKWCVMRPWTTMLTITGGVLISLVLLVKVVGMEFFSPADEGRFTISIETPVGSSLEMTDERALEVEAVVTRNLPAEYLVHYYSRTGKVSGMAQTSSAGTNLAEMGITLVDKKERSDSVNDIINALRPHLAKIHSVKISTAAAQEGGRGEAPIQVEITGHDLDELRRLADEVVQMMKEIPGASDVDQSYRSGQPEVRIEPDLKKIGRHHLTVRDLAMTLRGYVEGIKVSQFRDRGEDYDIRVQLKGAQRDRVEDVEAMFIKSPATGRMIPVSSLGRIRHESGPTVINRKDRRRLITVSAQLTGQRPLGAIQSEIERRLEEEIDVPEGIDIYMAGEMEMMEKNFAELFKAMATASVLTFLCVAGIIESFTLAVVILASLPVCLIGVTVALILNNVALNIFSLMAMVMLVGMVVNNAIIILDYATRKELAGRSAIDRITEACSLRFRMIIMANMTTVIAMIPLSLGFGFAGEIFRPLAVVVMGGVVATGSLSMIVIPTAYVMIENRKHRGHTLN